MFLLDTITRIMTEKGHEGLHRHAGVGQLGGERYLYCIRRKPWL